MFNQDLIHIIPILFLIATGLLLMMLDAFKVRSVLPLIAGIGFVGTAVLALPLQEGMDVQQLAFNKMIFTGGLASLVTILLSVSGLFTLFFLSDFLKRQEKPIYDIYALLVFAVVGMILLANANDLIVTFIGLETMSICLYIMAALFKRDLKSNEAGLKYFLLGAFATGFFIYGIALIYGGAGSTNYSSMDFARLQESGLLLPGMGLILIGFLFKVSAFPFHAWTPDVYSGSPTPLAGFMATGSKAAAFIAFGIFLNKTLPDVVVNEKIYNVIGVIALLTMIYGNVVAVQQKSLKRMLAYSSIAHSGYVLLALCAGPEGLMAAVFYMFIYTLMNIGAFGMIGMAELKDQDADLDGWKGLGMRNPWFGAAMSIFLFSLAGIPPLAGFMSKYFVFISAIHAKYTLLAILGIITSVAGAFYYIRVIVSMFFQTTEKPVEVKTSNIYPTIGVGILAALLLLFGLYPAAFTSQLDHLFVLADYFTQATP
ncbi:MAG: NADH-quinone oxidoreductase subunit N [Bacteroidia bacterium]|nr:NADH-quinone oxidoreductase subunit N [Bacteroidia bacterium]